ncbi:hypothetical protein [Xanthomonas arboricola]|uniref:hypothetical protein n=1 Tax=Xanthomonas arboricola TaxID=56448 RepID=UPI0032E86015
MTKLQSNTSTTFAAPPASTAMHTSQCVMCQGLINEHCRCACGYADPDQAAAAPTDDPKLKDLIYRLYMARDMQRAGGWSYLFAEAADAIATSPVHTHSPAYNAGGIELTACQLHEALLMAGSPELDVDFEDRGRVRIFHTESGHSGPGLYCECVDVEDEGCMLLDGTSPAIRAPAAVPVNTFQAGVSKWMGECFLPSLYSNMTERGDRLLEEVLELLQSKGYDQTRVATLVDYVYGRPVGEPAQEVGGVMVTLAGYCCVAGLDMHVEGARELERITQPEVMAKIRRKQEAKNALHFDTPLPGGAPATVPVDGELQVIESLLGLAYAAWNLADNAQDLEDCHGVDNHDFTALSTALDELDALPDDQPGYVMESAAKARWALRQLLATHPQPAAAKDERDGLYYIQDTRSYCGNCPMWWAPSGRGYVTRLDEAGRYSFDEAVAKNRCRETDIPWSCAEIDALARRTVDIQHMRSPAARLAEIRALMRKPAAAGGDA